MKRLAVFVLIASCLFFLAGCSSDDKQAMLIHTKVEEAAELESGFIAKQKELNELNEYAHQLYSDFLLININEDEEIVDEKLEEASALIEEQQRILEEAEENFQLAYERFLTIEENVEAIKDEDQRDQAKALITVMNERKELIDSFIEYYNEHLKGQHTFYGYIKEENFNLQTLDEQIHEINESSEQIEEIIQQFNQYTEQYIEVKNNYQTI